MAYNTTIWQNGTTPINAANLNHIEGGINTLDNNIGTKTQAVYDNTATYAVGSVVLYQNFLYRCITAVETPENFDSTKWTRTNILDVIKNANDYINTSALYINGNKVIWD